MTLTPMLEVDQHLQLGRALEARGHVVAHFVPTQGVARRLLAMNALRVFCIDDYRQKASEQAIRDYGLPSWRSLYLPELFTLGISENETLMCAMARAYLGAAERFLEENEVGCVVFGRGSKLLTRSFFYAARARKIPVVIIDKSPIPGMAGLYSNEDGRWEGLDAEFPWAIEEHELSWAREYIDDWRRRAPVYPQWGVSPGIRTRVAVFRWLLQNLSGGDYPDNFAVRLAASRFVKRRLTAAVNRALGKRVFSGVPAGAFVYLPLQYANETTLTMWAKPFKHQEYLVDVVARSLPERVRLAARPHPHHLGAYSPRALARMRSSPNVVLVDPRISPHGLLARCDAVVVTAGTSGFEALLYGKPVVTLGKAFYRGFGLTHDVSNLDDLEDLIARAVRTPPPANAVTEFVAAVRRYSYEGSYESPEALAGSIEQKRVETSSSWLS